MADNVPIQITIGNIFHLEADLADDDGKAIPLDGYGAKMQIRPTRSSSIVLVECTHTNGRIVFGANGAIAVIVDGSITGDLTPGTAVYSLELWPDADADRAYTILEGPVEIEQDVTR